MQALIIIQYLHEEQNEKSCGEGVKERKPSSDVVQRKIRVARSRMHSHLRFVKQSKEGVSSGSKVVDEEEKEVTEK